MSAGKRHSPYVRDNIYGVLGQQSQPMNGSAPTDAATAGDPVSLTMSLPYLPSSTLRDPTPPPMATPKERFSSPKARLNRFNPAYDPPLPQSLVPEEDAAASVAERRMAALEERMHRQALDLAAMNEKVGLYALENSGLRRALDEVQSSMPLVQGHEQDMGVLRRELRERVDTLQAEVTASRASAADSQAQMQRMALQLKEAADGEARREQAHQTRLAELEKALTLRGSASDSASRRAEDQFGAVSNDMAALSAALNIHRAETQRLQSGLASELEARRAGWTAVQNQVIELREALTTSGDASLQRVAAVLNPVETRMESSVLTVERSVDEERAARVAAERNNEAERNALAVALSTRLAGLEQRLAATEEAHAASIAEQGARAEADTSTTRRALRDEVEQRQLLHADLERKVAKAVADAATSLLVANDRLAAEQQRMQGAIEGESAARKASEAAAKAATASETNAVVAKLGDVHAASRKASGHLERRIRELEDTLREQKAADLTAIEDLLRSRQATQEQVNSELADRVHRLAELVAQKAGMGQDIEEQWFQELRRAMAEVARDTESIRAEMATGLSNLQTNVAQQVNREDENMMLLTEKTADCATRLQGATEAIGQLQLQVQALGGTVERNQLGNAEDLTVLRRQQDVAQVEVGKSMAAVRNEAAEATAMTEKRTAAHVEEAVEVRERTRKGGLPARRACLPSNNLLSLVRSRPCCPLWLLHTRPLHHSPIRMLRAATATACPSGRKGRFARAVPHLAPLAHLPPPPTSDARTAIERCVCYARDDERRGTSGTCRRAGTAPRHAYGARRDARQRGAR